ncbi:hypothetical protein EPI10_032293 [Gossypium australe]|uniref:Uncharacterized protein n=1 Tax=Gossypium australe TaxID=47621 RepID=A0A5B6X314_9ROSI|nr:hypothetical protein EPI10_032293 [Gossypium australe]
MDWWTMMIAHDYFVSLLTSHGVANSVEFLEDVSEFCIATLKGEVPFSEINHTRIILISKVSNPRSTSQIQLISLYNM